MKCKIKESIKSISIISYLIYKMTSFFLLLKYYNDKNIMFDQEEQLIIYMADGRKYHGGLTDRIRGIVSLYNFCFNNNIKFKIYFAHPFKLEEYLIPNKYNWIIESNKMIYNKNISEPVCLINCDIINQTRLINNIKKKIKTQFHVYTNMEYNPENFSQYFHILFKPASKLQELYMEHLRDIGNNYISISFRFQQLLGDFFERKSSALPIEKQEMLIKRCLSVIPILKEQHTDVEKILITSDSVKFLEQTQSYDYVYIVPGRRIHTDFSVSNDGSGHLETFLDFFLIASAEKVYSAHSEIMYGGKFAKMAAAVNNKPYEEINI